MDTLLTIEEVADILRCGREHVRSLCHSGKLGAINIGAGRYKSFRIPESSLRAYLSDVSTEEEPHQTRKVDLQDSEFLQKVRAMRG